MTQTPTLPQILLLPGNMCDARLWQGGGGIIERMIGTYASSVSIVDFEHDASIEAMAQRALARCEDEIVPIGFSMGGIVALEIARRASRRIKALGLIDTTSHADTRGPERLRQQENIRQGQLARVVTEELKPNYLAPCNAKNGLLLTLLTDMALNLGPEIFIAQSEALRTRADLTPLVNKIEVPVFLACGMHDTLCPPDLHRDMAAMIAKAHLHIVEDAGHILPLEQPAALARLLSDFLASALGPKP